MKRKVRLSFFDTRGTIFSLKDHYDCFVFFLLLLSYKCYISKPIFFVLALIVPNTMYNMPRGFTTLGLFFHQRFVPGMRGAVALTSHASIHEYGN